MFSLNFFNPTEEFVDKLIEVINGRFVIEIGCGRGALLDALSKKGVKIIGIDPYVYREGINPEISRKIMPYETEESIKLIEGITEKFEIVLLVARPCHSKFPQRYLDSVKRGTELIYIGYVKNLEIDFERELSEVNFIKFPEHPDCDCVAVLTEGEYDGFKRSNDWRNVDRKVQKVKGTVDPELVKWFSQFKKDRHYYKNKEGKEDEAIKKAFPGIDIEGSRRYGGNWEEWEGFKLMSRDVTKERTVELEVSTYMVGGGHFSCAISVRDESFIGIDKEGKLMTGSPWDRPEHRPGWINRGNLVWYGEKNRKRTFNLESGLIWLKQTYEEMYERYKKEIGVTLVPELGNGLEDELYQLKKEADLNSSKRVCCSKCKKEITQTEYYEYDGECEECF